MWSILVRFQYYCSVHYFREWQLMFLAAGWAAVSHTANCHTIPRMCFTTLRPLATIWRTEDVSEDMFIYYDRKKSEVLVKYDCSWNKPCFKWKLGQLFIFLFPMRIKVNWIYSVFLSKDNIWAFVIINFLTV